MEKDLRQGLQQGVERGKTRGFQRGLDAEQLADPGEALLDELLGDAFLSRVQQRADGEVDK